MVIDSTKYQQNRQSLLIIIELTVILLMITGSSTGIQTNDKNPAQSRFHSNRPHTITQMNDNVNMDSTIVESVNTGS